LRELEDAENIKIKNGKNYASREALAGLEERVKNDMEVLKLASDVGESKSCVQNTVLPTPTYTHSNFPRRHGFLINKFL
jgi:hypothetical protein